MRTWRRDGIASTAGVWRSVAAWGVLALACERGDDGPGSLPPAGGGSRGEDEPAASDPNESSTGGENTNDAGASPPGGDSFECAAPRLDAGVAAGWVRVPATGECCPYANQTSVPSGWLRFDDEAACETECLCSGREVNAAGSSPVLDPIECRCSVESCPSTLEEAQQRLCAVASPDVLRFEGCGLVAVIDYSGYPLSGYAWTFEQPSEPGASLTSASRLVGAEKFGAPSSFEGCSPSSWRAGVDIAQCDYGPVFECQLCGDSPDSDFPPCE